MDKILILDFGSQYTQLIARRIREMEVYCEIWPYTASGADIREFKPTGIILSGSPKSVNDKDWVLPSTAIWEMCTPILGICYGMHLISRLYGGKVRRDILGGEYGIKEVVITRTDSDILPKTHDDKFIAWMSHGDTVISPPPGFTITAKSATSSFVAAIEDQERAFYGVQFHPEVTHTQLGSVILGRFVDGVCKCRHHWKIGDLVETSVEKIKNQIGSGHAICALSGGVDSAVAAVLVHRAIKNKLQCVFVDTGLMRDDDTRKLLKELRKAHGLRVTIVEAKDIMLKALKGVKSPERKRKIIGKVFIDIFTGIAKDTQFLVQGTIYPDVIESGNPIAAKIKSHHNVGGLPKKMKMKVVEPLRLLFKDEVRKLGEKLKLDHEMLHQQPFPGPGLAIRIIGGVTEERLERLKQADKIMRYVIETEYNHQNLWQYFAILVPVKTVGVQGDERTYSDMIALRIVHSTDGMTANLASIPYDILNMISTKICNQVKGINRVVLDITNKPPATIEWE